MLGLGYRVLLVIWLVIPLGIVSFVKIAVKNGVSVQWIRYDATLICEFRNDAELEMENLKAIWERIDQNKSVVELESRGRIQKVIDKNKHTGRTWLKLPDVTKIDQGIYLCLVSSNGSVDYGKRTLLVNSPKDYGIKAGHDRYSVTLRSDVLIYCYLQDPQPPYYGWTKDVFPAPKDSRHQTEIHIGGMLTYLIRDIQEKDLGIYRCEYKNNTAMGFSEIKGCEKKGQKSNRDYTDNPNNTPKPRRKFDDWFN